MFSDDGFMLADRGLGGLSDFHVFGVAVYIKSWFLSCPSTAAPADDLNLLKVFLSESPAATGALKKVCGQRWYGGTNYNRD